MNEYKIINGTAYHPETAQAVIDVLERAMATRERVRLFLGDTKTGRDWCEEWDTIGTIGRSCGSVKIPLLIHNTRSDGGPAILDHCIIKITAAKGGQVLYQAPNYKRPRVGIVDQGEAFKMRFSCVDAEGITRACFEDREKAGRFCKFIEGQTNRK